VQIRYEIAVLDCELGSINLQEIAQSLKSQLPKIRLLIISPDSEDESSRFPVLGFIPDGYVWRPFNPEEITLLFQELLGIEPVDGGWQNQFPLEPLLDVPPPEPSNEIDVSFPDSQQPLQNELSQGTGKNPTSEYLELPGNRINEPEALILLPRLVEKTEARSGLLIRANKPWISAGPIQKKSLKELCSQALEVFPIGSSGSAIFFIHLETTQADYQAVLYYLDKEILLVLVYDTLYPLRKIRSITAQQIESYIEAISQQLLPRQIARPTQYFAFVIVPARETDRLTGAISIQLEAWIREIMEAHQWPIQQLYIKPDYVMWISPTRDGESARMILSSIKNQTSQRLLEHFSDSGTQDNFWSNEHLLIETDQPPSLRLIRQFIQKVYNQT
jgi:REP element-mobilizing transposase RayT